MGGRKLKSQVAAMESKLIGLEDQLDSASKLVNWRVKASRDVTT